MSWLRAVRVAREPVAHRVVGKPVRSSWQRGGVDLPQVRGGEGKEFVAAGVGNERPAAAVGDDVGRPVTGGDAPDPRAPGGVVERQGVVADVDHADEVVAGGEPAGLGRVGEPVHGAAVPDEGEGSAEFVGDRDGAVLACGGVVRVVADRDPVQHGAGGQGHGEQRVGVLVRYEHRPAGFGQLEVAQVAGERDPQQGDLGSAGVSSGVLQCSAGRRVGGSVVRWCQRRSATPRGARGARSVSDATRSPVAPRARSVR